MADRKITVRFDGTADGLKAATDKASKSLKDLGDDGEKHGGRIGTAWENLKGKFAGNVDEMVGSKNKLGGALTDLGVTGESVMGGALPAAAAAAAVGIGLLVGKAVAGFSSLVTETDKLSQVSNLLPQDASRWIEVAGDWGVSVETLTKTFGKLGIAIGKNPAVLKEYGIELGRTKTGALDMGTTLNNVLDSIGNQSDASVKDAEAQKLLGKSYAELAPLIALTRTEREKALAGVNASKVVTAGDIATNRELKRSFEDIKDAGSDSANALGKLLLPKVEEVAHSTSNAAHAVSAAVDWITRHTGGAKENAKAVDVLSTSAAAMSETFRENARSVHDASVAQEAATTLQKDADAQVKGLAHAVDVYTKAEDDANKSIRDRTAATQAGMGAGQSWAQLQLDLIHDLKDVKEKMDASTDANGANIEKNLEAQLAGEKLNKVVADAGIAYATLHGVTKDSTNYIPTQIAGLNELRDKFPELAGIIDIYIAKLSAIPKTIVTTVTVDPSGGRGGAGYSNAPKDTPQFASGGFVDAPVGQAVPAIVHGGEFVIPADQAQGLGPGRNGGGSLGVGGMSVVINMPPGSNGEDVVRAIQRYERLNGTAWRKTS